ncbi:hypothetical protein TVAG_159500 [Trichomonas vaginalis G3]|uniref:Uncharacterized protein n=1 Tax=Trichomonas vaginalis (strain ATCC PRA-98 / G3) TaxID=412133 RepID=A2F5A5_TRIV3|nr:phospholipase C/P1 nuclease family [Trichomonas vaginalis G3]EAX99930.1 hypothetical protein TVAG_159500 [Trichomonas vaginalis G3]KAI5547789.1 phospholipase C/P1 nuclease family [Trichomonas vaginalis G3]|eukprot:XP_001312860.1 hypothetical protein [Trichomonas vaginalis G3]
MIFILFFLSRSWSEEYLTIGTELIFRKLGNKGISKLQKVIDMTGEKMERPSLAGSWLASLLHAPSNTNCFDHWRYSQKNINAIPHPEHHCINKDDLECTLDKLNKTIMKGTLNGPWPYNFGFKVFLTLYMDSFDPVHVTEYFDNDTFIDGDDNGKKFNIKFKGKNMSLHDFWETGCGRYVLKTPFNGNGWKEIEETTTRLYKRLNDSKFITPCPSDYAGAINQSFNLSKEIVYNLSMIQKDNDLPEEYIKTCYELTDQRILQAANVVSSKLKYFVVPDIVKIKSTPNISSTEIIAWGIFFLVAPVTVYLGWRLCYALIQPEDEGSKNEPLEKNDSDDNNEPTV